MRISKVKETLPTCDEKSQVLKNGITINLTLIPRQRRHLISAQLVSQLIHVQLVLLD